MNERDLNWLSEALPEWQGSPVTQALREAMRLQVEARKAAICNRYLAGKPVPEAERVALLMVEQWAEDFFDSTAEDVLTAMEMMDERVRHQAD